MIFLFYFINQIRNPSPKQIKQNHYFLADKTNPLKQLHLVISDFPNIKNVTACGKTIKVYK